MVIQEGIIELEMRLNKLLQGKTLRQKDWVLILTHNSGAKFHIVFNDHTPPEMLIENTLGSEQANVDWWKKNLQEMGERVGSKNHYWDVANYLRRFVRDVLNDENREYVTHAYPHNLSFAFHFDDPHTDTTSMVVFIPQPGTVPKRID